MFLPTSAVHNAFIHASLTIIIAAGLVPVFETIIPNGIESVNGSDISLGSTNVDPICIGLNGLCILTDGLVPTVDTSVTDWASELLTIKKVQEIPGEISLEHVLLTFNFAQAVQITAVYIDLLFCPQWGIGAPVIFLYAGTNDYFQWLSPIETNVDYIAQFHPIQTTCNCSMSTVVIPVQGGEVVKPVWHLYVTASQISEFEWLHVAEVRFSNVPVPGTQVGTQYCTYQPIPGE